MAGGGGGVGGKKYYMHVTHAQLKKGSDLMVCFEVNQHGVKCGCLSSCELAFNSLPLNTTQYVCMVLVMAPEWITGGAGFYRSARCGYSAQTRS